ncbi:MAG: chitobiase/beta-hexosaminidase C-terminal domain-containing protein [Chloroflexi bacterium]|nr:chitobiase/beta-hexosaminidase C-terminal domain-containing protein [Chloroflexota bacterium]
MAGGGYYEPANWLLKVQEIEQPIGTPLLLVNGQYGTNFIFTETNAVQVTLQTSFASGAIHYTLDGSAPSSNSIAYAGEFTLANTNPVTRTFTVRAIAYNAARTQSAEADPVTVTFVARPLFLAQEGTGTITRSPDQPSYALGQQVTLTANAGRYYAFLRWSDGVVTNPRTVSIGATNNYLAVFTNTVPLEWQVAKVWEKSYGGNSENFGPTVIEVSSGGYLVVGKSWSYSTGGNKLTSGGGTWILRLDPDGNRLWEKAHEPALEWIPSVVQTADGGFLVAGSSSSDGLTPAGVVHGGTDYMVRKLNGQGDFQWEATFGGEGDEHLTSEQMTADGGYDGERH